MIKKLGIVFIVLLIFVAAASVAYAGNPEGTGDTGTPARTYTNPAPGTSVYPPANVPAGMPSGSAQKDGGSQAGSYAGAKNDGTGDAVAAPVAADGEVVAGADKTGSADRKEDPDAAFRAAIMKVLKAGKPVNNGQFIITIKKPENIEGSITTYTYETTFEISGETEYTDAEMLIAMLNKESGVYELIELPDGDQAIDASSGAMSTELELEPGEYNLLLIAYRTSEKDPELVQYTPISVTVYRDTWLNRFMRTGKQIIDWVTGK